MSDDEIRTEGIREIIPIPDGRMTFRSYADPKGTALETNGDSQFTAPVRRPTEREIVTCIGLMAAKTVEMCMGNHFYTIGGQI